MASNNTPNIYSAEYENGSSAIPASSVIYNNSESGLEAVSAQGAIDEIVEDMKNLVAGDIGYNNTASGLIAETAQAAIDEIEQQIDDLSASDISVTGIGEATDVQSALDYITSVQIAGAKRDIEDIETELSKTLLGEPVDILALFTDATNPITSYEFPSDGYLYYTVLNGTNFFLYRLISNEQHMQNVVPQHATFNNAQSVPVKKGFVFGNVNNTATAGTIKFYPLVAPTP